MPVSGSSQLTEQTGPGVSPAADLIHQRVLAVTPFTFEEWLGGLNLQRRQAVTPDPGLQVRPPLQHTTCGQAVKQAVERDTVHHQPTGRQHGQDLWVTQIDTRRIQKNAHHRPGQQGATQSPRFEAALNLGRENGGVFCSGHGVCAIFCN
jgi:hypothetical protein